MSLNWIGSNFLWVRQLLTMIIFHDAIFSEIPCEIFISFIFLEGFMWQFPNCVSRITLQRALVWFCWHKGELAAISPLPGLQSGWAASGADLCELLPSTLQLQGLSLQRDRGEHPNIAILTVLTRGKKSPVNGSAWGKNPLKLLNHLFKRKHWPSFGLFLQH